MADHQKAAITPQMTCLKDGNDLEPWANSWKDCADTLKQDGKDAVNWAQNEDRIGYIVPYRWDEAEQQCPDGACDELMSFWHDYGQTLKP